MCGVIGKEKSRGTKRKASDDKVVDSGVDSDSDYDDAMLTSRAKTSKKAKQETLKERTSEPKQDNKKFEADDSDSSSSDDDDDVTTGFEGVTSSQEPNNSRKKALNKASKDGFEIVSAAGARSWWLKKILPVLCDYDWYSLRLSAQPIRKLDPVGLAIGEELVKSAKRRREIIDGSYNRSARNNYCVASHAASETAVLSISKKS